MKLDREKIVYKKVEDLKLNPKNPRKNDDAVRTVAKSIEKYGFKNPLIIDENNVVWCGNTRLKASRTLGLEEVPCIVAGDLTEEQIRELALIDNKSSEIAEWDFELLGDELADLDLSDFELDWNIDTQDNNKIDRKDISDSIKSSFELIVNCEDEVSLEMLYNEMIERGYECKISTL